MLNNFSKYSNYVYVTDSGSLDFNPIFHKTNGSYYRSQVDKSTELFSNTNCKGCLYICSDIEIEDEQYKKILENINNLNDSYGL